MPVPAGPRRAAPPRKKAYKSPSASLLSEVPTPTAVPEATEEAPGATPTGEPAVESTPELESESVAPPALTKVTSHETVESPEQDTVPSSSDVLIIGDVQKEIGEVGKSVEIHAAEVITVNEPQSVPVQEDREEEEEEEDEEERRRRVTAKLSQMGAVNPLAGPPPVPRRESIPSPTARRDSGTAPVPTEELDVEDEVNVDPEEVGESTPPPAPARNSPQAHVEEAREADESASHAGES